MRFKPVMKRQDRINWRIRVAEGTLDGAELEELRSILANSLPDPLDDAARHSWFKNFPPLSLASDGYLPFLDNVREAHRHGVGFIAHPGGSTRDDVVTQTCRDLEIALINTGVRAFHH